MPIHDALRVGEVIIKVAMGKCSVCKQPIAAGNAVQLSKNSVRIRHLECMPKTDGRSNYRPVRKTFLWS